MLKMKPQIITKITSIKYLFKLVFVFIIILYSVHSLIYVYIKGVEPKFLDCGTIVSKANNEIAIKNGLSTELYLNIEFEKSGFRSVKVNHTAYFKNNIGQHVCFYLNEEVNSQHIITCITALITIMFIALILAYKGISIILKSSNV